MEGNGLTGSGSVNGQTASRSPLATRALGETHHTPAEALAALLQRVSPLPKSDKSGPIQWQIVPEELHAFEQVVQSLPRAFGPKDLETH
jgi:hypothetical protein